MMDVGQEGYPIYFYVIPLRQFRKIPTSAPCDYPLFWKHNNLTGSPYPKPRSPNKYFSEAPSSRFSTLLIQRDIRKIFKFSSRFKREVRHSVIHCLLSMNNLPTALSLCGIAYSRDNLSQIQRMQLRSP